MGWFKKIFKGSKHKPRYNRSYETYRDDSSSEAEEDQTSKNGSDEALARALHQNLNAESSHQYSNGIHSAFENFSYQNALFQESYGEACYVCRNTPYDKRYVTLNDGRKLCLECMNSSIMDTNACQSLYFRIREFFEGIDFEVKEEIPLLLVDREGMKSVLDNDHVTNTRGVCLCEETTVWHVSSGSGIRDGNQITEIETEPYELTKYCEVTGIVVLYGLPRLLTGKIIAHELMHAWLRLNGYKIADVDDDVEEGMCELLAHMWLLSQTIRSDIASTPFDKKLVKFLIYNIETNASVKYGDSFRAGLEAVKRYGLEYTLHHIRKTASFPE